MRAILVLTYCLAFALAGRAAEPEKHKGKHADQAPPPPQQQQVKPKPGKHVGSTASQLAGRHNVSRAPFRHVPGGQSNKQEFKAKHFDLAKSPKPDIASAKFKEGNRVEGSEKWEGKQYTAFKTYRAQWHDRTWWRRHHTRIVLILGGWYFWDAGFWFPAWGYDPGYVYYPYDGPIYAYNDLPPDQVVANVQAALQAQGYYHGEVDGLLGPLTRAALADYQRDHKLYTTAAIDEPTLASLGFV
jgi:hypothetical protein